MKKHLVVLTTLLMVLAAPAVACDDVEDQAYLLDEILRLSYEGVPDRIIIKQMRTMEFVFCISSDDIIELRGLGVSDDVLEAIIETSLDVEEQRNVQTRVTVRVSPGYWSPWYRYPSAWGAYYDPFPAWYSYHYYPFLYSCGSWYGWSSGSYYYAYHWYDYDYHYSPHDADYRYEPAPDRLAVRTGRGAQQANSPRLVIPASGVTTAPRPVSTTGTPSPGTLHLRGRVDAGNLAVAGTRYGATEVAAPSRRESATGRQRILQDSRSGDLQVHRERLSAQAAPRTPQVQPRVRPQTRPRRLKDFRAPTLTIKRPESRESTVKKRTPQRVRPVAKRQTRRVTAPPKYTRPAKHTSTRVTTPSKRSQQRVAPSPKRTVQRAPARAPSHVKSMSRSAPVRHAPARRSAPPKASRPRSR